MIVMKTLKKLLRKLGLFEVYRGRTCMKGGRYQDFFILVFNMYHSSVSSF